MSSVHELSRQLRLILTEEQSISLPELLSIADDLVATSSVDPEVLSAQLEQELHSIHDDAVDHSSPYHAQILLAVLYHLKAILTPLTIITFWFDIVLRPALREPKLSTSAVNHSKELIVSALHSDDERYHDKIRDFRTRIFELYLYDALNETSGGDILEWGQLNNAEKEKRACWKSNLEDVLLRFGGTHPSDLMTDVHEHFNEPSSRLQLMNFMNQYTSTPRFGSLASTLAKHPLMSSLLSSLLFDNSSTCCTVGLTILVKLLPVLAVHAGEELKAMIPRLFAIFVRVLCWKERLSFPHDDYEDSNNDIDEEGVDAEASASLVPRPELGWQQLKLTFDKASSAPPAARLFTFLYYLFPCNLLRFFRRPVEYLTSSSFESPYSVGWEEALDVSEIRTKCEHLLRGHICHPLIIWNDADAELSQPDFWSKYDVARISSEAMMLDVRYTSLALRERHRDKAATSYASSSVGDEDASNATEHGDSVRQNGANVSLQSMVATSVLLKSTLDVKTEPITSSWSSGILSSNDTASSSENVDESVFEPDSPDAPSNVTQAISTLQRDVLLLRNELNFELWMSRENTKHIGRLFQDRIITRNAEVERQGLYNKLRNYRTQVVRLEKDLREHKEQASSARHKYTDWSSELQNKLREFREEKKSWITEAATLRTAQKEALAQFNAQGKLLAEANSEVFKLQTYIKENQHKIDRLHDYEAQIEQFHKMQRLWDADFAKFNKRGEDIEYIKSKWKQMELRLESLEKTQIEMEDKARQYRRNVQSLESRLAQEKERNHSERRYPVVALASVTAEKASLMETNRRLGEKNDELLDEVEELKVMVELLKGQVSERKGLISEPKLSSPVF